MPVGDQPTDVGTEPSPTLYVQNLNEKVRQAWSNETQIKKPELKKSLYALFTTFGKIIDVVACKTDKMRGQAFIVFEDTIASASAMRNLQSFPFYEKNIKIAYAKSVSRATLIKEGRYFPMLNPEAAEGADGTEMGGDDDVKMMIDAADAASRKRTRQEEVEEESDNSDMELEDRPAKKAALDAPEGKALTVRNLPSDVTDDMIEHLFKQYPGFSLVRMVPDKDGMAFVEFASPEQALAAKKALDGYNVTPSRKMIVEVSKS